MSRTRSEQERRVNPREINWQFCELGRGGAMETATLLNLSNEGLLILTAQTIPEGEEVEVELPDLTGAPIRLRTRVARQVCGETGAGESTPIALGLSVHEKPREYDLLAASLSYNRMQKTKTGKKNTLWLGTRRFPRKTHIALCELQIEGESHEGMLRDISERGMFVHTSADLATQASARVLLKDRSGSYCEINTVVVRQDAYPHGLDLIPESGVGLTIEGASRDYLEMVSAL